MTQAGPPCQRPRDAAERLASTTRSRPCPRARGVAARRRRLVGRRSERSGSSLLTGRPRGSAPCRSPAIGAATSPPRPPCSTRTAMTTRGASAGANPMNHECGSPVPTELGRPGLAGGRDARDLGPGRELRGRGRPRPPASSPPAIAGVVRRSVDAAPDLRGDGARRRVLAVDGRDETRPHEQFAIVRDRRGHEGHLERRHERLALAVRGIGQLDVIDEAARVRDPLAVRSPARPRSAGRTGSARRTRVRAA